MLFGVCTKCGDTYHLPSNMWSGGIYKCLHCGQLYKLKVVSMDEFVFNRFKSLKPKGAL